MILVSIVGFIVIVLVAFGLIKYLKNIKHLSLYVGILVITIGSVTGFVQMDDRVRNILYILLAILMFMFYWTIQKSINAYISKRGEKYNKLEKSNQKTKRI